MRRGVLSGILVAAIVVISAAHASTGDQACRRAPEALSKYQPTAAGESAPAAPFFEEGRGERTLADFRGSGLIVNFWATWCAPCVKEMPALDRLSAELNDDEVKVLTLSADRGGASVVKGFYAKNGIEHLPVMIDAKGVVARSLKVPGLPTTVLFDAQGREVGRVIGVAEWDDPKAVAFLHRCLRPSP